MDTSKAPAECPGVASESAGKQSACQGCPNQNICASGKSADPDPDIVEIGRKLHNVKQILLVLSGKGGVGKSTISSNIARGLAANEQLNVGLLDIDICGPSIPRAMGLEEEQVHMSASGWSPIYVQDNLAVMSCGFLLGSLDDAVIWRGPKKNGLIKQFLRDVNWTELDYLVIDTPPGTSDEHLSIVQYLKSCSNVNAVIVTTPQEVALLDVRKQIDFCKRVNLNIIGLVTNMAGFVCPKCSVQSDIFRREANGAEKLSVKESIPILGSIPLDPMLGKACDEGASCFEVAPESKAVKALQELVVSIQRVLKKTAGDDLTSMEH